jgi:hypothetical protein
MEILVLCDGNLRAFYNCKMSTNFLQLLQTYYAKKNPIFIPNTVFKKFGKPSRNSNNSVADPGCLSRIQDPDFYPSRIPDPGSRILDLGSRILDLGSRIPDLGSQIPDPKTATRER